MEDVSLIYGQCAGSIATSFSVMPLGREKCMEFVDSATWDSSRCFPIGHIISTVGLGSESLAMHVNSSYRCLRLSPEKLLISEVNSMQMVMSAKCEVHLRARWKRAKPNLSAALQMRYNSNHPKYM